MMNDESISRLFSFAYLFEILANEWIGKTIKFN